jgi:hypothetical protein
MLLFTNKNSENALFVRIFYQRISVSVSNSLDMNNGLTAIYQQLIAVTQICSGLFISMLHCHLIGRFFYVGHYLLIFYILESTFFRTRQKKASTITVKAFCFI